MADELPTDMLLQLPEEMLITILNRLAIDELGRMNLVSRPFRKLCGVSSPPRLMFKSTKLSFDIGMQPLPDLMFESSDGGLSFVNGLPLELMTEDVIDEVFASQSFPRNLSLENSINSFLDLMFESPKLKSLLVGADLVFQTPQKHKKSVFYRSLKVEFPKPTLPLANGTGSSSASSLVLHRKHLNIAKLQLELGVHVRPDAETRSTADSLIDEAVERKVKEMDLDLQYHKLPCKVFTVSTIRVLKLKRCKFELNGGIDLPNLRELHLESTACDQQSVRTLLSCCPLIEILKLSDHPCLTSLHVCELPKLHSLIIYSCATRCVEIDAPGLRKLSYSSHIRSEVVLRNCEFLKELHLQGDGIEEDMLQYFLSNLPNLDQLEIWGTRLKKMEISHSNLKLLSLSIFWGPKQTYVELDTPNLQSFSYSGYIIPLTYAMTSVNVSSLQELAICMGYEDYDKHHHNIFISKLKEFFDKLKHCRVIELTIPSEDNFFFRREFARDQILYHSPPFCDIKHLILKVSAESQEFDYIINQVLWMCHPQTLSIRYENDGHENDEQFLKTLYNEFMTKDDGLKKCCIDSPIKCWRHYLEDFQINADESEMEIDRVSELSKFLKPKIFEKDIRFKLKWR